MLSTETFCPHGVELLDVNEIASLIVSLYQNRVIGVFIDELQASMWSFAKGLYIGFDSSLVLEDPRSWSCSMMNFLYVARWRCRFASPVIPKMFLELVRVMSED